MQTLGRQLVQTRMGIVALWSIPLVVFVGCLGNSTPTGTVTGKVTYKGQPVPKGCLVTFISDAGFAALGTVDDKGDYQLMMAASPEVPVAKYNVSVTYPGGYSGPEMTEEEEQKFNAGDPTTVAKFSARQRSPIPEKYSDSIRSGLIYEIKEGENTYDIPLK